MSTADSILPICLYYTDIRLEALSYQTNLTVIDSILRSFCLHALSKVLMAVPRSYCYGHVTLQIHNRYLSKYGLKQHAIYTYVISHFHCVNPLGQLNCRPVVAQLVICISELPTITIYAESLRFFVLHYAITLVL